MRTFRLCLVVFLVLQSVADNADANVVKEVTHEDIRDGILSLVHLFRENADKLERHELRERQLGEQLKKIINSIEKNQKNESDVLQSINKRLDALERLVVKTDAEPTPAVSNKVEEVLQMHYAHLEQTMQNNKAVLQNTNDNINQILNALVSLSATSNDRSDQQRNAINAQLTDLQSKLQDQMIKLHNTVIEKTQDLSSKVTENLRKSVTLDSSSQSHLSANDLQVIKNELVDFSETEIKKLQEEIGKSLHLLSQEQEGILATLTNSVASVDSLNLNVRRNNEQLLREMKGLSKIEQVLSQTADIVLDIKRRMEYGNHEVLIGIEQLVKEQNKELNQTVNKRFDGISYDISNSQNGALTNLSLKIETEVSQVWRQIGIMYQTLTNSADALDKLQQHSEIYVNGSLTTLDHMQGKVATITNRMTEVDENLNYLLGRLSLVTQEFNQIKTGLGDALDKIRGSFRVIQSKVKDAGPGPNPIEEDATTVENLLFKSQYSVN